MRPILLASSSPYRRQLLSRLGLHFDWASPDIDETPRKGETANELVNRLSYAKAHTLAEQYPAHIIIGSDQAAVLNDSIIGKPYTYEQAFKQLQAASSNEVMFKTGLCLLDTKTGASQSCIEEFSVSFRRLTDEQIHHYLTVEQPYDCAGSFKCEGLGIALFTGLKGTDPNSLIGLPLIRLVDMLKNLGIDPLLLAQRRA